MIFEQEKSAPDLRVTDMHTHSEASHDSSCKISDMRDAQAARGTSLLLSVTILTPTHMKAMMFLRISNVRQRMQHC